MMTSLDHDKTFEEHQEGSPDRLNREEWLKKFIRFDNYFKGCFKENPLPEYGPLFEPESKCASQVLSIISKEKVTTKDLFEIVRIFNETAKMEHYNGTGWFDFSLHLGAYLRRFNVEVVSCSREAIIIRAI